MLTVAEELQSIGVQNIWGMSDYEFKQFVIGRRIRQGRGKPDTEALSVDEIERRKQAYEELITAKGKGHKALFYKELQSLERNQSFIVKYYKRSTVSRLISEEHERSAGNARYITRVLASPGGTPVVRVIRII